MKKMIVMMGGQGVGKGTFSAMLRLERDYNYVEVGAILRSLSPGTEIGRIVARGELVPDNALFNLLRPSFITDKDIILDGFPRSLSQAKWLLEQFSGRFDIRVIYLDVPENVMLSRINKRIRDGGNRADDADAIVIRRRLDNFWKCTMPAIEWLRNERGIKFFDVRVDGSDVNENFAKVRSAVYS